MTIYYLSWLWVYWVPQVVVLHVVLPGSHPGSSGGSAGCHISRLAPRAWKLSRLWLGAQQGCPPKPHNSLLCRLLEFPGPSQHGGRVPEGDVTSIQEQRLWIPVSPRSDCVLLEVQNGTAMPES